MKWNGLLGASFLSSLVYSAATTATITQHIISTIEPNLQEIESAAATAVTDHSTSSVAGKAFDRFIVIWLENTDDVVAADDPDLKVLAEQGITLTNYWALTHPSEPNYMASVGGDYFGLDNDDFKSLPKNVSTVADLLDDKNITWGEYQEHLPYSGFVGFNYSNQVTYKNDYVRKHNPLALYGSVTSDSSRLSKIKNLTEFYKDLENHTLPQWMFITPNMTNDAHDSNITTAGKWCKSFLEPLLENGYFMSKTLILLTFDENESYQEQNKVWSLLLGGSIDKSQFNTTDDTYYTHYSEISTVEDNWDLHNLGRFDANNDGNANVFKMVSDKSGYKNKIVDTSHQYFNKSVIGYWSDIHKTLPDINCSAIGVSGKDVLPSIKSVWCPNLAANNMSSHNSSASTNSSFNSTLISSGAATSTCVSGILGLVSLAAFYFLL